VFLYLGGQYKDGTTDVTRTYHFGTPNNFEKDCFTRVLKGHIAIDKCIFPEGTTGYRIDILARNALWQVGLNFLHGTGHGVGHFLNVHEGPHGIGFRRPFDDAPLTCGMIVTDEPGYYHDGEFGIRIENILIVESKNTKNNFPAGNGKWFGFRPVTLVPLGLKLIDKSILNKDEIEWINNYHKRCLEEIKPLLEKDSLGYKWLIKETAKLE
jgi:Xaa-Pro aminopeptidase